MDFLWKTLQSIAKKAGTTQSDNKRPLGTIPHGGHPWTQTLRHARKKRLLTAHSGLEAQPPLADEVQSQPCPANESLA